MRALTGLLVAGAVGLAACSGAPPLQPDGLEAYLGQDLVWGPCDEGVVTLQCATLTVPVDYDRPDGDTLGLAVVRRPATGSRERTVGTLVVDVGGPAVPVVGADWFPPVSARLQQRFDVVGHDPRGTAGTAMRCLPASYREQPFLVDATPDDRSEVRTYERLLRRWAQACQEAAPDLLHHLGTPEHVHDLEVLRAALGEERLHLHAQSYGTRRGAEYVARYPDRVGRTALVSLLPTTGSGARWYRERAVAHDAALVRALDHCVAAGDCPLGADREEALARLVAWLRELDVRPLRTEDGRALTRETVLAAIGGYLAEGEYGYEQLRRALTAGYRGQTWGFVWALDQPDDGVDLDALTAQLCLDAGAPPLAPSDARALAAEWEADAPVFGEWSAGQAATQCLGWPKPTGRVAPRPATGAGPVLLVTSEHDPATPTVLAEDMQAELPQGVLLRYEGGEHLPHLVSRCVREAVDAWLIEESLPQDLTCPAP